MARTDQFRPAKVLLPGCRPVEPAPPGGFGAIADFMARAPVVQSPHPNDYCAECGLQRNQHGTDGHGGQAVGAGLCTGFRLDRAAVPGIDNAPDKRMG